MTAPRMLRRLAAALTIALASACAEPTRPDILVITVDTLRADHLGCYGAADAATTNIDLIAAAGTIFDRAVAPMPMTRPSHYSMLTGRYPREHGVMNNAMSLPDEAVTLAERLSAEGYRTAAFTAVSLLDVQGGAAQGFDHFDSPQGQRQRAADAVVPLAEAWIASAPRDEPLFVWVHLFDPHLPYDPPAGYRQGLDPALAESLPRLDWDALRAVAEAHDGDVPTDVLDHARALYRAEIAFTDLWVGKLFDGFAAARDLTESLVLFTADHGEAFEKGVWFEHTDSLYDGAIRIPLIAWQPGVFEAGARVSAPTTILDVMPTALVAAGLQPPEDIAGRPLQDAASRPDRWILVQHPFHKLGAEEFRGKTLQIMRSVGGEPTRPLRLDGEWSALVGEEWKFLAGGGSEELYRVAPAPDEETDLASTEADVVARMRALLDEVLAAHPLNVVDPGTIHPELLETLRELGYMH